MERRSDKLTPMFQQYQRIKAQYPDVLLLFRLGDFYEMFGDDARIGSQVLQLVLTSREIGRGNRVPMCGVPTTPWSATSPNFWKRVTKSPSASN
jgi:DNA mismatch repair protein MutS